MKLYNIVGGLESSWSSIRCQR